ncbi:MAG: sodium/proline symporter [Candidatus Babeliales bacterium]|jgi:sodium/proline symporter
MNMDVVVAFGVYFTILGSIGFFAYRKSLKAADFILGSRSLNYWITALAAHASDMSGWLFMGFPAAVYAHGLIEAWTAIGLVVFMYFNWKFVAPRLRILTERYQSPTISSFFSKHFDDKTGLLRTVTALFCLFFFMFYISANFVVLGHLFESLFSLSYATGIYIGAFVVFYILLGGYLSIAWVDFFQGLFLLAMIILVPLVAFFHTQGIGQIVSLAHAKGLSLNLLPHSLSHALSIIMLAAGWGLGYFGQPHIVTKFMGIKNVKDMPKAQYVGLSWQTITLGAAICVGLIGIAFFPQGLANNELIFVTMTKALFSPFCAGIILCAIMASAINVIGAQVLASASILAEDFYGTLLKRKSTLAVQIASRVSVVVICVIALSFALINDQKSIYDLVYYAWTGLGCSFGPLMLVSLQTNMKNTRAAIAGVIVGGIVAGVWPHFNSAIPAMIPGFTASLASIGIVAAFKR